MSNEENTVQMQVPVPAAPKAVAKPKVVVKPKAVAKAKPKPKPKPKAKAKKVAAAPRKKSSGRTLKRYGAASREKKLEEWLRLRRQGINAQEAARKVGVPYITLHGWAKKAGAAVPSRGGRRHGRRQITTALKQAVAGVHRGRQAGQSAASAIRAGGLTLVTPNGFRIEGISSRELIAVLKALR